MNAVSISVEERERRRARRLPIRVRVRYADTDEFLADHEANISGYGMYIRTDEPLDVGVQFRLCFDVEGLARPVETVAEVRWNHAPGDPFTVPGMGVMFQELAPKDQVEIDRLLMSG
jgi:uncharacterized protein (TIGR02266 family)